MNFYYSFLLLLVVPSAYSEGPQYAKPLDPLDSTLVTVYPNSSSAKLGVLPVLPQNEVYKVPLPQNEIYIISPPQNKVSKIVLPQNKALTLSEVLNLTLSGVFDFFLPPNGEEAEN
jgi:hypothetical protein